MDLKW